MALKSKPNATPPPSTPAAEDNGERPRSNAEIEARLEPYIADTREKHDRYVELVQKDPDYAARLLSLKDMFAVEREHVLSTNEIAGAKEWLQQQPVGVKARVQARVDHLSHVKFREVTLLTAVRNQMRFSSGQSLRESGKAIRQSEAEGARQSTGVSI